MAFGGNFHRKADSHLVCVETDGTHATQTISCRTSSKKRKLCLFHISSVFLSTSTLFFMYLFPFEYNLSYIHKQLSVLITFQGSLVFCNLFLLKIEGQIS